MDIPVTPRAAVPPGELPPAARRLPDGRLAVSYAAVLGLAGPLVLNSGVQSILNLTDTWFIGRLSTQATAAMGAIYWLVLCGILLLGGVAMSVQTFAAQGFGARRYRAASNAAWSGVAASLCTIPAFIALGFVARPVLEAAGIDAEVRELALAYWWPRFAVGGPLALIAWSFSSFFNGVGKTRDTLVITLLISITNAIFNEWFMFGLDMGIAGSAWGTVAATAVGVLLSLAVFLGRPVRLHFQSHLTWRRVRLRRQFTLGLPMGLAIAADLFGFALFQLMLVRVGAVAGAATQIVTMLTSLAYGPGVGIALAGTTLVGQSMGQRRTDWAMTIGNAVIGIVVVYMGGVAVLLAIGTPWVAAWFINGTDPNAAAVLALCGRLMWIAAGFQVFDALNLGSGFCLRGAGDARVPAILVALLAWCGWVPLTHMLTFAPGEGYVHFLPQFGWGPTGGWWAALIYVVCLGLMLNWRWRSGAWRPRP